MKRFLPVLLTCLPILCPSARTEILTDIRSLNEARSANRCDAAFNLEATVIYNDRLLGSRLVVQEGPQAVLTWYHASADPLSFVPGDRIRLSGLLRQVQEPGQASVVCTNAFRLSHGTLPFAPYMTTEDIEHKRGFGCALIRTKGTIIDIVPDEIDRNWMYFVLMNEGKNVFVAMRASVPASDCEHFLGDFVCVTGFCHGEKGMYRTIKAAVTIDSTNSIEVIRHKAIADLFDAPDTADPAVSDSPAAENSGRKNAVGTVLATWNGNQVLLQSDSGKLIKGVLAKPDLPDPGSRIKIVGFPETDLYTVILVRAAWRTEAGPPHRSEIPMELASEALQTETAGRKCFNLSLQGHLVRIKGVIRSLPTETGDTRIHLESDGRIVAIEAARCLGSATALETGCTVQVTGTCVMETERTGLNLAMPRINGALIVPRTPEDLRVLAHPPWWTPQRFAFVIFALILLLIAFFVWNVAVRRVAERRSRALLKEQLAHIESDLKIGERTRLAVELHDSLSQSLTGVALEITTVDRLTDKQTDNIHHHLNIASRTLASCRNELRACLWDLRSQALESNDMNEAIRRALEPYVADTAISIRFNVPRDTFTDNTAHTLLRIIRELVTNAIRHGQAKNIWIAGSRENGRLLFSVRDDGCGFDVKTVPGVQQGHFGLQGINERLRMLRGRIAIESSAGVGTKATVSFDLSAAGGGQT